MNELLEGTWNMKSGNLDYTLYLPGPNTGNGGYSLGDHFSFHRSRTDEDGSGVSDNITGTFSEEDGVLQLKCRTIMVEGWGPEDEEEIDEEPCVNEYEGEDFRGELNLSGDEPVIRMNAFDDEIELKKVK